MSTTPAFPDAYRFGRFELRPAQRLLLADGAPLAVGSRAFDLLVVLVAERDRVVSTTNCWTASGPAWWSRRTTCGAGSGLRKLLGHEALATVPGRGYRFTLPARCGPGAGCRAASGEPWPAGQQADADRPRGRPGRGAGAARRHPAADPGRCRRRRQDAAWRSRSPTASAPGFADGVWFVELAPVTDPALVVRTIAACSTCTKSRRGRCWTPCSTSLRRAAHAAVVLDNCEHLVDACARLAEAAAAAVPGLRILATSREALGVAGESGLARAVAAARPDRRRARPMTCGYRRGAPVRRARAGRRSPAFA